MSCVHLSLGPIHPGREGEVNGDWNLSMAPRMEDAAFPLATWQLGVQDKQMITYNPVSVFPTSHFTPMTQ